MAAHELVDALCSGRQSLARYDAQAALTAFETALNADRDHIEAEAGAVCALWMLRHEGEARSRLCRLQSRHGDAVPVLLAEGLVCLGLRDDPAMLTIESSASDMRPREALDAYDRVLLREPHSSAAMRGRAVALRALGRLDEAGAQLAAAVETHGPLPALVVEQAWVEMDRGEPIKAREALSLGSDLARDDVEWLLTEAEVRRRLGDWQAAVEALDRATAIAPDSTEVLEAQGWRELDEAERADGIEQVKAARSRARDAFELVLRDAPLHPGALVGIAELARLDFDATPGRLRRGLGRIGLPLRALIGIGEYFHGPDESLEAKKSKIDDAIELAAPSPQLIAARGWLELRRGEPLTAAETFREALGLLVPKGPATESELRYLNAWVGLVRATAVSGDSLAAREALAEMDQIFPDHPEVLATRGWFEIYTGSHAAGREHMELACRHLDPVDFAARRIWANSQLGLFDEAERIAKEILGGEGATELEGENDAALARSSVNVLFEAAISAEREGRCHSALKRFETAARLEPCDQELALRVRRLRRWMLSHPVYWLLGRGRDADAFADANLWAHYPGIDLVAPEVRHRVAGQLRALQWRRARIQQSEWEAVGYSLVWAAAAGMLLAPLLAPLLTNAATVDIGWRIGTAILALTAGYLYIRMVEDASPPHLMVVTAGLTAAGAWVVVEGVDRLDEPLFFLLAMALVAPAVALVPAVLALTATKAVQRRRIAQLPAAMPEGSLLNALLELAQVTAFPIDTWSSATRDYALQLLETVARSQEALLQSGPVAGNHASGRAATDLGLRQRAAHRAASAAACTRALADDVLAPTSGTSAALRSHVLRLLEHASTRQWGRFPKRTPEPLPTRVRARAAEGMRLIVLLGMFGVVVALLVETLGEKTAQQVLIVAAGPTLVGVSKIVGVGALHHRDRSGDEKGSRGSG